MVLLLAIVARHCPGMLILELVTALLCSPRMAPSAGRRRKPTRARRCPPRSTTWPAPQGRRGRL